MEEFDEIEQKYSDDLIQSELYSTIKRGNNLTAVEFLLCSRELKEMYLSDKRRTIGDLEFKSCDDDLKLKFIDNMVLRDKPSLITNEKFETLSPKLKSYYINQVIPKSSVSLDNRQFKAASDSQKIEYILYRGLEHVSYDVQDWYEKWRKIKQRDIRIDLILLEE